MNNYKLIYKLQNEINEPKLLGPDNIILKFIEELFECELMLNYSEVFISNVDDELQNNVIKMFSFLEKLLSEGINFNTRDLIVIKKAIVDNVEDKLMNLYLKKEVIVSLASGKAIYPKTLNQAFYIND